MNIQCDCGNFKATIKNFINNSPGRLVCYCDDCQTYLHYLQRGDLLDNNGGSEVIPAYPSDVHIIQGIDVMTCHRLAPKGMFRFSTICCKTPIANIQPNTPWIGFHRRVYAHQNGPTIDQQLGPIRSRVMGAFAKGTTPEGTAHKINLSAILSILPFMLKGYLLRKTKPNPFFTGEYQTDPIAQTHVLTLNERNEARLQAGFLAK